VPSGGGWFNSGGEKGGRRILGRGGHRFVVVDIGGVIIWLVGPLGGCELHVASGYVNVH